MSGRGVFGTRGQLYTQKQTHRCHICDGPRRWDRSGRSPWCGIVMREVFRPTFCPSGIPHPNFGSPPQGHYRTIRTGPIVSYASFPVPSRKRPVCGLVALRTLIPPPGVSVLFPSRVGLSGDLSRACGTALASLLLLATVPLTRAPVTARMDRRPVRGRLGLKCH
jgi:hypothetical protein